MSKSGQGQTPRVGKARHIVYVAITGWARIETVCKGVKVGGAR